MINDLLLVAFFVGLPCIIAAALLITVSRWVRRRERGRRLTRFESCSIDPFSGIITARGRLTRAVTTNDAGVVQWPDAPLHSSDFPPMFISVNGAIVEMTVVSMDVLILDRGVGHGVEWTAQDKRSFASQHRMHR